MGKASVNRAARRARGFWLFPLLVIVLAAWYALPARHAHRARPAALEPAIEPIEVAAPVPGRTRLVTLPPAGHAGAAPAEVPPEKVVETQTVSALSYEAEMAELTQRAVLFQSAFEREARDAAWASDLEAAVRQAYPTTEGVDAILAGV